MGVAYAHDAKLMEYLDSARELEVEVRYNAVGFERAASTQVAIEYKFTFDEEGEETDTLTRVTYNKDGDYNFHVITLQEFYEDFKEKHGSDRVSMFLRDIPHGKEYEAHN